MPRPGPLCRRVTVFSTKVAGWLALIVVLICVGLVTLQVLEFLFYRAEPSVWLQP